MRGVSRTRRAGLHLTTENTIKGRGTSPDMGVGPFDDEVTSSSGGSNTPGEETGVLRWRGGGMFLGLDEDVFPLGVMKFSMWRI